MQALLPLVFAFGLMWLLMIRPQQRRLRQHQAVVASLQAGDEVVTGSGICGTIVSVDDDVLALEVAPGVSIRVLKTSVSQRVEAAGEAVTEDIGDGGQISPDGEIGSSG